MNAGSLSAAVVDLDDTEGLLTADRDGLLRAASMAGAQVRATAAALDEGVFDSLRADGPPRTVVWVAGRGNAETAAALLAALLGGTIGAPLVVAAEAPPWLGALDVLIVAGDDPADPALVSAAATGVRRGARVVVVAPYEGPLRDATAARAVALPPRLPVPDDFTLVRYLAAGLAVLLTTAPGFTVDLSALADELDDEALRNSAARDTFTNPAKELAQRMIGRDVVLAGDTAPMRALARHGCAVMLRLAYRSIGAAGLADVLVALAGGWGSAGGAAPSIFHDDEFDGPLPDRTRTVVLTTDADRPAVSARLRGFDDVDVINAGDVPDIGASRGNQEAPGSAAMPATARPEQQVALLAVRLEMAAVYQRLIRG
ncbi:TobH protein [Mycobacterium sp. SMC-4]|uniref:TobH protein n=1 Tax=Mycobacterium sp. SMC-4 TaxID=2857059 RepID=UPI0021B4C610|nr:TobH protein [Mycobacterium sp. SMC-4]UXA19319.1 TobH protein [Mycobacterium sp. SMC-4]